MQIRCYTPLDHDAVIALWQRCGLVAPQNNPSKDIERKQSVDADLFLVGERDGEIVGSVMGGYDGHRGWINYLAVCPSVQRQGLGRRLLTMIEERIVAKGCPKINLQVRETNSEVLAFYAECGYQVDKVTSLGKRFVQDKLGGVG